MVYVNYGHGDRICAAPPLPTTIDNILRLNAMAPATVFEIVADLTAGRILSVSDPFPIVERADQCFVRAVILRHRGHS